MDPLPDGWIDLEPVLLDRSGGRVVLDCIATRVCLGDGTGGGPARSGWLEGDPVGVVLDETRAAGGDGDALLRWLRDGARPSLLLGGRGPTLLLERGTDVLALGAHEPAPARPGGCGRDGATD